MAAARVRLRIVGQAEAFRAMWRWLAMNPRVPVTFEPTRRRRMNGVIRIEPTRNKRIAS